jgi:hypothetical protein
MISNYHHAAPADFGAQPQYNYSLATSGLDDPTRKKIGKDKPRRGFFGRKKPRSSRSQSSDEQTISSAASSMAYSYTDSEQSAGESTNSSVFSILRALEDTNGHMPMKRTGSFSSTGSISSQGAISSQDGNKRSFLDGSRFKQVQK